MATCDKRKKNVGFGKCAKMPGYFKMFITTPDDFEVTPEQAIDPAFWQAAIEAAYASRIYLWPELFNNTPEPEETIYQSTALGKRKVRNGKYEWLFNFSESLCFHRALYTHGATSGRILLIDTEDAINGTENAAGNLMGYKIDMFSPEKMVDNTGDEVAMSPVRVTLKNTLERDRDGIMISVDFLGELERLTDANIEVVSAANDEIVVRVSIDCDGTEILGLVKADFVLLDDAGDPQTITTSTDNGDGTYTLAGAFESGTINLVSPATLSIDAYEGIEADVVVMS
jgi:hypothetical protein